MRRNQESQKKKKKDEDDSWFQDGGIAYKKADMSSKRKKALKRICRK